MVAVAMISLAVSAQDLGKATEAYNNAAGLIQADKAAALKGFQEALKLAEACEEDADGQRNALIENCKTNIVNFTLSIAKDLLKDKEYDKAYDQLKLSLEVATKYEDAEKVEEVNTLIPTVYIAKGNQLLKDKDALGAAGAYVDDVAPGAEVGEVALAVVEGLSDGCFYVFDKLLVMSVAGELPVEVGCECVESHGLQRYKKTG